MRAGCGLRLKRGCGGREAELAGGCGRMGCATGQRLAGRWAEIVNVGAGEWPGNRGRGVRRKADGRTAACRA